MIKNENSARNNKMVKKKLNSVVIIQKGLTRKFSIWSFWYHLIPKFQTPFCSSRIKPSSEYLRAKCPATVAYQGGEQVPSIRVISWGRYSRYNLTWFEKNATPEPLLTPVRPDSNPRGVGCLQRIQKQKTKKNNTQASQLP